MVATATCVVGIRWGLPSQRRNDLYFRSPESLSARQREIREGDDIPRSTYNPIRTYHPDEYFVLKMLAHIKPSRWQLDPRYYHLGGAFVYPYGLLLFILGKIGLVTVSADPAYYLEHPRQIAAFYLVGRLFCVLFAVATVFIVYDLGRRLHSRTVGFLSALTLCVLPTFALHAHFLYVDIPVACWTTLCLWALVTVIEKPTGRRALLAGLAAGLAVATKVSTAPLVPVMAASILLTPRISLRRRLVLAGGAVAVSVAVFCVTNPFAVLHIGFFSEDVRSNLFANAALAPSVIVLAKSVNPLVLLVLVVGVFIAFLSPLKNRKALPLAAWVVALFFLSCIPGKRYARYLLPILPAAAVLAALPAGLLLRHGRKVAAGVLFGVPFLYNVVWTASLLSVLCAPDTRTRAGELMRDDFDLNTSVAVTEKPWQYEMPAFDDLAYKTLVIEYDIERLEEDRPAVFITSDVQRERSLVNDEDAPTFWPAFDELVTRGDYLLLHRVDRPQRIAGYDLNSGLFPEDLRYQNPVISIYVRSR